MDLPSIETLGPRIIVSGPSNSGKSTLTRALGRKLERPVVYLDLLYHLPNTNWVPRPKEEFVALHDAAIAEDCWVIEGNYFGTITQRMARATGIILLGSEPWRATFRNIRRTLFETGHRAGQLEGGIDSLNWNLTHFILVEQPKKRARDQGILRGSGLPMVEPASMRELNRLYEAWDLRR